MFSCKCTRTPSGGKGNKPPLQSRIELTNYNMNLTDWWIIFLGELHHGSLWSRQNSQERQLESLHQAAERPVL